MKGRLIIDKKRLEIIIQRLCFELIENHNFFENTVILGLQPRGIYLANRIVQCLKNTQADCQVKIGSLDATFFRDDFRRKKEPLIPNLTQVDFIIEDKKVVLIDDVLYTGRTIRAGLDAMLAYGRPELVELMVLIDRRYSRHLPIEPSYVGLAIDSLAEERVAVEWNETDKTDRVILFNKEE